MEDLLTVKQVAKKLNVHRNTVCQMIYSGRLKAKKLTKAENSGYRIRPTDLKLFLETCTK